MKSTALVCQMVSTHSRLKAAGFKDENNQTHTVVSTHSRLKAAGWACRQIAGKFRGFNTQPPEGGWLEYACSTTAGYCFNTQPPEGGWKATITKYSLAGAFQHTAA